MDWIAMEIGRIVEEMGEMEGELIDEKKEQLSKAEEIIMNKFATEHESAENQKVNHTSSLPLLFFCWFLIQFSLCLLFLKALEACLVHNRDRITDMLSCHSTLRLASSCSSFLRLLVPVVSSTLPLFLYLYSCVAFYV